MRFIKIHALVRILLLSISAFLGACVMFNSEAPTASATFPAESPFPLEVAASGVFAAHGFQFKSRNSDSMTFQRAASKMDEVLYGNWNESKSFERVVVRFTPSKPGFYKVSLLSYALRGSDGMEDLSRRAGVFKGEYKTMLREMREKLSTAEPPTAELTTPEPPTPEVTRAPLPTADLPKAEPGNWNR